MTRKFEIEEELLAKTLNYLAVRPYAEVAQLLSELQGCKPIDVLPPDKGKK
jgi:hypothetical protein